MRPWLAMSVAAALGLAALPPSRAHVRLLTIPQEDRHRSRMSPSSASLSADGRYVALKSYARLLPDDGDDRADIYVVDLVSGGITLESGDADPASTSYSQPRLSADGRFVAFEEHRGHVGDVVLVIRDRMKGTVNRIAGGPHDWTGSPAVSDDGGLVAFASTAPSLVDGGDENGQVRDVFTLERRTAVVRRVSLGSDGRQRPQGESSAPAVSGSGRFVTFTSTADFGCPRLDDAGKGPVGAVAGIYLRDAELGMTRCVSGIGSQPSAGSSYDAVISRDGRYAAFVSESPSLASDDRNRSADVFLRDLDTAETVLISRSAVGGAANGGSRRPAISGDARFVVFQSDASDLVCASRCGPADEDINLLPDIFLLDRLFGRIQRISADAAGGWIEESVAPAISADGTVIAFSSRHPIDGRDLDHDFDLFVRVYRPARTGR